MTKREEDSFMLKAILLKLNELHDFCRKNNLDIKKLEQAEVVKLPMMFGFYRPSNFKLPKNCVGLEHDIESQAKPLLGVQVLDNGGISIVTTEYTHELANN